MKTLTITDTYEINNILPHVTDNYLKKKHYLLIAIDQ